MILSTGGFVPASFANVGSRSIVIANSSQLVPAGIFPGHRITHGSRIPPSMVEPFQPDNGPFDPPGPRAAPLSDVNTTSVFLSMPSCLSVSKICPVDQSISSTASPNLPLALVPSKSLLAKIGRCGIVWGR